MRSLLLAICLTMLLLPAGAHAAEKVDFVRDIAPIFQQHCIRCHSPNIKKGAISLATLADLKKQGQLEPGDPEASHLLELITPDEDGKAQMPKEGAALKPAQVALIRQWVKQGAVWPEAVVLQEKSKADKDWWSLQPLSTAEPPAAVDGFPAAWAAHPIDRFIAGKLAEKKLQPSPPASRRELIRRATYDLTGLPPSPEEVAAFIADDQPGAFARVVGRLLASPRYGERWGRHWLDVVRFGESNGFERNVIINNLWPFRDYVIRSFNEDKPFDRFIHEHLAGDVLAPGDPAVVTGSAFLVCGPYDNVGNQDAVQARQIRANTIDEMIRATSEAFLGLTVGCARCHNHKFDPILQADYYAMYATFAGVRHGSREIATPEQRAARTAKIKPLNDRRIVIGSEVNAINAAVKKDSKLNTPETQQRLAALKQELAELTAKINAVPPLPSIWVGSHRENEAKGPFFIFLGGSPEKKGEAVSVGSLNALGESEASYTLPESATAATRRKQLAQWITAPGNALPRRVLANRLWHYHFGAGIVNTPSDFGYMGGRPSHPQLLDWLAAQLDRHGWKLKAMHRTIMLTQTYQQSAAWRKEPAKVDSDARLLWRFPPRRLSAEEIRDTMLHVSGKLNLKMGGPGFRMYEYQQDNVATYVPLDKHPESTYRRAVYHQNARAAPTDLMAEFDQPDCAFSTPRRARTTTPLQALTTLNHSFTLDMAAALASRIEKEAGAEPATQVRRAFALCYNRQPTEVELKECTTLLQQHPLSALCRVLLNTSELIYVK